MKKSKRIVVLIATGALLAIAGISYYYFVATLSLSDIVGNTSSPIANLGLRLFDFDTGLTRYDIVNLKQKSPYWAKRIKEVESIYNANEKSQENARLIEEMLADPTMQKIARKFGVGNIDKIFSSSIPFNNGFTTKRSIDNERFSIVKEPEKHRLYSICLGNNRRATRSIKAK